MNNAHNDVILAADLHFVPYDFRHTFATRAADAGMPLATLAAILGHGNLRSVLKYVHPAKDSMDREMENLDALPVIPEQPTKGRKAFSPV